MVSIVVHCYDARVAICAYYLILVVISLYVLICSPFLKIFLSFMYIEVLRQIKEEEVLVVMEEVCSKAMFE